MSDRKQKPYSAAQPFYDSPLSVILALVLIVAVLFGICSWFAHMEAAAFYRVTGKRVSTWDAMFIELRVEARDVDTELADPR